MLRCVAVTTVSTLFSVGLAHNAEHTAQGEKYPSTVLSESKQDSKHPETKRRHIYSAVTSNKTHNSGIRAANRATKITQAVAGTITNREGRRSEPFPIRQSTHVGQSASQQVQDTKIERASQRQSRIPRYRKNTRKQERIQLNFNKKPKPKNLSPRRNVKSVVTDTRGMQTLEKRAFVSAPSTDNSKTLTHDVHLPETILTALRLLLDKRNSFQNDSDALRLASVLLMNKDGKSDGKSGQTIDPAGLAIPERTTSLKTSRINSMNRGMRFIADLLSGANNTKSSLLTARKSSIWADLVDPTELGVSILKLLFGSKASMVVKPKDKTLLNRVSAEPLDSGRSNGIRVNFHRATPTLSRMEGRRIYHAKRRRPTASESYQTLRLAKLRPGRLTSRGGNSHEKTFTLANAVSELITNLNRKELSEKRKGLFQKKLPTSAVLQRPPAKINVDVNGRRKSWVLLKIPKENNPMENDRQNEPAGDVSKSESSNAVSKEGNVLITGKIRPEPLAPQSQNKIPDKDAKAKEMAEKLSEAQDDDLNKSSSSSKLPNDQEALSVLPTQKVTDKEQRLDHQEDLKPSSQSDQSSLMTKKLVQTVQKLLKVVQSSIKAFQTNKQASSAGVPILEPKSSRPAVDSQVPDVKSATGVNIPSEETHLTEAPLSKPLDDMTQSSLERITASARELDPLRGVPTVDEAITVPSPSAIGTKPGPEENVLFQSDTVLGTARDTTDVKKIREGK